MTGVPHLAEVLADALDKHALGLCHHLLGDRDFVQTFIARLGRDADFERLTDEVSEFADDALAEDVDIILCVLGVLVEILQRGCKDPQHSLTEW